MNSNEVYQLMNQNPVFQIATCVNNQPYTRNFLLYRANENGIIFHTGKNKAVFNQITINPKVELCFWDYQQRIQVRVIGELELIEDKELKIEICNHPSREFMKSWIESDPKLEWLAVFRLLNGKFKNWTLANNLNEVDYVQL